MTPFLSLLFFLTALRKRPESPSKCPFYYTRDFLETWLLGGPVSLPPGTSWEHISFWHEDMIGQNVGKHEHRASSIHAYSCQGVARNSCASPLVIELEAAQAAVASWRQPVGPVTGREGIR